MFVPDAIDEGLRLAWFDAVRFPEGARRLAGAGDNIALLRAGRAQLER